MHPLLEELHQNHLNLAHVLRHLGKQLANVRAGEHIDLDALTETLEYVESHSDLFHHQRENIIFLVYLERCGGRCDLFEQLLAEHVRLFNMTHEITEHFQQWRRDSPVPRERVVAIITDYLRLQWSHLNLEENAAFSVLDQELTTDDWARIEASAPIASDPLFGNLSQQRFVRILDQLGL